MVKFKKTVSVFIPSSVFAAAAVEDKNSNRQFKSIKITYPH